MTAAHTPGPWFARKDPNALDNDAGTTNLKEPTMTEDQIARVCHEVNRAYCQALGDNSQPTWEEAPQWQRQNHEQARNMNCANTYDEVRAKLLKKEDQ